MIQGNDKLNVINTRRPELSWAWRHRGFSLLELMIVVAIIAILASIAYPTYQGYITRTNHSAAQSVLLEAANRQEQFFADNKRYAADRSNLGYAASTFMINAQGEPVADASPARC